MKNDWIPKLNFMRRTHENKQTRFFFPNYINILNSFQLSLNIGLLTRSSSFCPVLKSDPQINYKTGQVSLFLFAFLPFSPLSIYFQFQFFQSQEIHI